MGLIEVGSSQFLQTQHTCKLMMNSSSNEGYKEDTIKRADAIDIGGFLDTNDNGPLFL